MSWVKLSWWEMSGGDGRLSRQNLPGGNCPVTFLLSVYGLGINISELFEWNLWLQLITHIKQIPYTYAFYCVPYTNHWFVTMISRSKVQKEVFILSRDVTILTLRCITTKIDVRHHARVLNFLSISSLRVLNQKHVNRRYGGAKRTY